MNIHETTKRRAIFRLCNRIAERTESNRAIWVTWGCELLGLPGDYSPDLVVKAHNEAVRVDNETGHAGATAKAIIGALTAPAPIIATRCTMHEAKRHFEAGGAVLVSEYGHEPTQTVTASTTTHDRTRTTWDDLAETVNMWRNRYPNQRFYIVPTVDACTCSTDEDACPDHPGDPCPACGRRSGHDDGCTDDDAAACEGFGNLIGLLLQVDDQSTCNHTAETQVDCDSLSAPPFGSSTVRPRQRQPGSFGRSIGSRVVERSATCYSDNRATNSHERGPDMETISYNAHPLYPLRDVHGWDDLARLATEAGSHWFDADTRRFFGSRLLGSPMLAHRNEDRTEATYVGVTSEYDGFGREGRDYSVRVFSFRSDQTIRVSDGRTLDVVDLTIDAEEADGERLRHRTAKAAHAAARRHVEAIRAAVWLTAVESVTA